MKLLFKLLEKMKINVFNTQCRIGSKIRYKGKIREVYDINRLTCEMGQMYGSRIINSRT